MFWNPLKKLDCKIQFESNLINIWWRKQVDNIVLQNN